ncbi:MAG: hypothetical protein JWM14_1484 [Chitinophagaceae bacterium]|nr:hypothetical protein [Chitinophagaceae bacterium]
MVPHLQYDINKFLQEIEKHSEGTLDENRTSLQDLINILGDLVDSLADAKIKIPEWKYHLQTLVNKIIFTSTSINQLTHGYNIQSFKDPKLKFKVIDYPSIYILTRSLIENYVTLCYIYNNKLEEGEKLFRFKLWQVSGLLTRQNFSDPKGDFNIEKKEEEAEIIQKILLEIEQMDEFKNLEKRKLNQLKNYGLHRVDSWHKLIDESNLKQPLFSNTYSFFSDYAHSEYLSILQIGQSSLNYNDNNTISNAKMALAHVRMIIALCVKFYISNYKTAEIVFNTYPSTHQTVLNIWANIAEKKQDI